MLLFVHLWISGQQCRFLPQRAWPLSRTHPRQGQVKQIKMNTIGSSGLYGKSVWTDACRFCAMSLQPNPIPNERSRLKGMERRHQGHNQRRPAVLLWWAGIYVGLVVTDRSRDCLLQCRWGSSAQIQRVKGQPSIHMKGRRGKNW